MKNKLSNSNWGYFLFFLLPAVIVVCVSCSNSPRNRQADAGKNDFKDTIQGKPSSSFSDTITIGFPTAVFYTPDKLQLGNFKAISLPLIFESTIHDCFYQMNNSRFVLKKYYSQIKIIEVKNARYLLFEMAGGEKEYIDLNKNDLCGMFIFDGRKAPLLVDMTNVDTQLGFYFSK